MGIIIAGYAGIGKSAFCKKVKGSIDLPNMPYKWIMPYINDGRKDFEDIIMIRSLLKI